MAFCDQETEFILKYKAGPNIFGPTPIFSERHLQNHCSLKSNVLKWEEEGSCENVQTGTHENKGPVPLSCKVIIAGMFMCTT